MEIAELSTSLRTLISALHKGLRKQTYSVHSYSMTEMETIGHLMRNSSLLPSELAGLTRVKTQSMSQILKKLESQGILIRTPSGSDRRKTQVSITVSGRKMVEKMKYDRDEWLKECISKNLSEREIGLLVKV
ncbi:MAG: MarR family transcriptional regulator, partial [Bacteroidota bacterium]|nr:MarR family transcriptional regulator [Bacteroidota bacterium]